MSIRRLNRPIKPLAQKGTPGAFRRRIQVRIDSKGKRRDWHPTKGWRLLA